MAEEEFDIGEAFDEIIADEVLTPPVSAPAEMDAPEPAKIEDGEPVRDEKGRFAPKAKPAEEVAADAAPADPVAEAPAVNAAPAQLPKEIREAWGDLPDAVKESITRREEQAHQMATRVDRERQIGRSFEQVVAPYQQMIADDGGNPLAAVTELFETARGLREGSPQQKAQLLNLIATRFGIDIEQAYYQRPDPQVARMELDIRARDAQLSQYRAMQDQTVTQNIDQTIAQFAADKPYFEQALPEMTRLAQQGVSQDLQELYDIAIARDETLRSASIEQAIQARLAQEEANRSATVQRARRAAISPTSAPGTAKPPGSSANLSPEEQIALDYERIMSAQD